MFGTLRSQYYCGTICQLLFSTLAHEMDFKIVRRLIASGLMQYSRDPVQVCLLLLGNCTNTVALNLLEANVMPLVHESCWLDHTVS